MIAFGVFSLRMLQAIATTLIYNFQKLFYENP